LQDYDMLVDELELDETRLGLFSSGEEALRSPSLGTPALWIVNVRLPDMSGIGFLNLVRRRMRRSSMFLVGDKYSAVDELSARAAGATAYFCKPPSAAWLDGYRFPGRSPAIRGPTNGVFKAAAVMRPP
jgi:DNA-binding response OmpR family regulator